MQVCLKIEYMSSTGLNDSLKFAVNWEKSDGQFSHSPGIESSSLILQVQNPVFLR